VARIRSEKFQKKNLKSVYTRMAGIAEVSFAASFWTKNVPRKLLVLLIFGVTAYASQIPRAEEIRQQQQQPPPVPLEPLRDPVIDAYNDSITLKPDEAIYTRYIAIGKCPDKTLAYKSLSSHVNRLSSYPLIKRPRLVGTQLLAIDLRWYGWSPKLWDSIPDPYFLINVKIPGYKEPEVEYTGDGLTIFVDPEAVILFDGKPSTLKGEKRVFTIPSQRPLNYSVVARYSDGQTDRVSVQIVGKGATIKFSKSDTIQKAFTPFCNTEAAAKLINITQAKLPVVDGRFFFNQTAIQFNRNPGYYDFLGIVDEKSLDKLVGFDEKVLETFPKEFREAISKSTVTHQPRRIDRASTVGGGYWRTSDNDLAVGDSNPLRVLGKGYKFKARESFSNLPNGFIVWGLFNNVGVRQDNAPDFIASDGTAPGTDKRVHINLSCVRCHVEGVRNLLGWVRSQYQPPRALPGFVNEDGKMRILSYEELQHLEWLYMTKLEPYINSDRLIYALAVQEATGCSILDDARNYGLFWAQYEEVLVDANYMAADLAVSVEVLRNALQHQLAVTGQLDPLLANFLPDAPQIPIGIHQWEELFPSAQVIVRGGVPQ
jgi:hypothetical protein